MAKTVWGIELGTASLKAIKVQAVRDGLEIVDIGVQDLPPEEGEKPRTRVARVEQALTDLRDAHNIKGSEPVFISIPGHQALNKLLQIDFMDEKTFEQTVEFEAQQQLPLSLEQIIWDYQIINRNPKPGDEVQVSLFAVRKEIINDYIRVIDGIGLRLGGIQVAPLAIYNFVKYDQKFPPTGVVVDIGAQHTDVLVLDQNKIWVRNIPGGGRSVTNELTRALKVDFDKAEDFKRNAAKSKNAQKIFQAMKPALRDQYNEVVRSLAYYKQQNEGVNFRYMMLMGSGAQTLGLKKFYEQQFNHRVDKLTHLKRLRLARSVSPEELQNHISGLSVAIGLAVQGAGLAENNINLVPRELKVQEAGAAKKPAVLISAAIMVVAALLPLLFVSFAVDTERLKNRIDDVEAEAARLSKDLDDIPDDVAGRIVLRNHFGGAMVHSPLFGGNVDLADRVDAGLRALLIDDELSETLALYGSGRLEDPGAPPKLVDPVAVETTWPSRLAPLGEPDYLEFLGWGPIEQTRGLTFDDIDADQNGFISLAEMKAARPPTQRSQIKLISLNRVESLDLEGIPVGRDGFYSVAPFSDARALDAWPYSANVPFPDDGEEGQPPGEWSLSASYADLMYSAIVTLAVPIDLDPFNEASLKRFMTGTFFNTLDRRSRAVLNEQFADTAAVEVRVKAVSWDDDAEPRTLSDLTGGPTSRTPPYFGLWREVTLGIAVMRRDPGMSLPIAQANIAGAEFVAVFPTREVMSRLQLSEDSEESVRDRVASMTFVATGGTGMIRCTPVMTDDGLVDMEVDNRGRLRLRLKVVDGEAGRLAGGRAFSQ
jgi:type IV pilus assembly protein PilM